MKKLWRVMAAVVVVTYVSTAAPTVFDFTAAEGFVDGYIGSGNNGSSPDLLNGWDFQGGGWAGYGYEDTAGSGYMTFGANWTKISNGQYYWVGNVGDTLSAQIDFGLTLTGTLATADILQIVFAETGLDANASAAYENSDRMTVQALWNGRLRVYHAASNGQSWPQLGPSTAPSDSSFIDAADLSAIYSITIGADAASSLVTGIVSNRADGSTSTFSTNTVSTKLYNAITGNGAFFRMYQGNKANDYKVLVDKITLPEQDTRVFLTVDNLELRNNATTFGTAFNQWSGTANQGEIAFAPDFSAGGNLWGNPAVVPMRWSGVDLDEDGNDDYFDFELHASHSDPTKSAVFAGNGFGASPWSLATLEGDLTFEIKNVELSSGTSGTVSFEQFTGGGIMVADWGEADTTWPFTSVDMNGVTVGGSNDDAAKANVTHTSANNIFSSSTLVVNNPSLQTNYTEQIWFRNVDFAFSYVNTNASTIRVDSTNTIEFVTSEGYSDGVLTGQNGMAGGSNWVVNTANGGAINSAWFVDGVTNQNQHITLPTGIANLVSGDEVSLTIDLTIDGELHSVTGGAAYAFNLGFQADNSPAYTSYSAAITNDYTAVRLQRFNHNTDQATYVRLLSHPWVTLQGYGYGGDAPLADVSDGDQLQLSLTANIGDDAASSSTTARYINFTAGTTNNGTLNSGHGTYVNNNVTPFPESLYAAFTGETGAHAFFEAGYEVQNWPTNITITRVELAFPVEQLNTIGQSAYSVWAAALGLTDAQTNLTADVDGDGFNNLFEYTLNGDPTDDSSHGSPVFDADAGTYSYTMRTDDDALTVTVLETTDLVFGTWTTNTSVSATTVDEAHDAMVNSVETSDSTKFIRLIIERD
jgi:hypothetical protein